MAQSKAQLVEYPLVSLSDYEGTPSDGQILTWSATLGKWVPGNPPEGSSVGTEIVTPGDPSFSSVSLLLLGEGEDGGTVFTDSSGSNFSISTTTGTSTVTTSTANRKFGTSSIWFNSFDILNVKGLKVENSSCFDLSSGPWTIECWFNVTNRWSPGNWLTLLAKGFDWRIRVDGSSSVAVTSIGGLNGLASNCAHNQLACWNHLGVSSNGSSVSCYWNGAKIGEWSGSVSNSTADVTIGTGANGLAGFSGYMDNIRITTGIGRYSGETVTIPSDGVPSSPNPGLPVPAQKGQLASDGEFMYICTEGGIPGVWRKTSLT